jgi:hypothetical protein
MGDEADKVRGPVMVSDPEVLKAARHFRRRLGPVRLIVEEKRRLRRAKAALAGAARGPEEQLAHGADAATYADELEDVRDVLAWFEAMVDAVETSPENFVGLTAEEINAGWRVVRDNAGAEMKFLLEALPAGETPTWMEGGGVDVRHSPSFNLLVLARRTPDDLWDRPPAGILDSLVAPSARAALSSYMDKQPSRALYLEMSRALQAALQKAVRGPEATPRVVDRSGGERLFGKGDRVYHRRRDLFGLVLEVWSVGFDGASDFDCNVTLVVKFEPPWDPDLPPESLPAEEFMPAFAARGN